MELFLQGLIKKIFNIYDIVKQINKEFNDGFDILSDLDKLETNFVITLELQHIDKRSNEYKNCAINSQFLIIEEFSIKLNKIINKIIILLNTNKIVVNNNLLKKSKKKEIITLEIQKLLSDFSKKNINHSTISYVPINYNKCNLCANEMIIDTNRSELYCNTCGMIRELIGTVFDDTQFYSQEGQKAKSGTFNPNRHFQFWWTHILAKESEEELGDKRDSDNLYGEKILKQIKDIIRRDRKILQLLTINDVRNILRELKKTDLNKNVPLILKKITGIGPPNIPDHITLRVENLFTKAIEIGEKIKQNKRINRNYYPYYIYRIVEAITTDKDTELRRVLFYIYIQSKETVESDDLDWEKICGELKEIEYKPTDRTLGQKYNYINL
jgi:hypothetical protein